MENVPFINDSNFNEIVNRVNFNSFDAICSQIGDFIDHSPFMSKNISFFILECINYNRAFEDAFKIRIFEKSGNSDIDLSRCIYATYLGANTNICEIKAVSNIFSSQTLESEELKNYDNRIENFYCLSILREMCFDLRECVGKLLYLSPECVINAIIKDQSFFNLSVLVKMCKYLDFFEILASKINQITKKNEIIGSIFLNYFSDLNKIRNTNFKEASGQQEAKNEVMRSLLQGDSLDYCLKIANKQSLGILLNKKFEDQQLKKISLAVFNEVGMEAKTKSEFFDSFILLTSPSISHFLSYLEQFKKKFKLTKKEQIEFIAKLKTFHSQNTGYLEIAIEKLLAFKIVKKENLK